MSNLLVGEEKEHFLRTIERTDSAPAELDNETADLAHQLSLIYGRIRVSREASGLHLYVASPACLEEDGEIELHKLHLAINVEKYLTGEDENMVGLCMKTGTPYSILDLLSRQPLDKYGYELKPEVQQASEINLNHLEDDGHGNMVPKSPGEVIPVYKLPHSHPAQEYLRSRNFNAIRLYQQFRLSYCERERDDVFYRKLSGGFKATSQGRLIFFIDVGGVQRGWQARILEKEEGEFKWFFHPYSRKWVKVLRREDDDWLPIDDRWEHWDPVKYLTSHGARRNSCVMGFDAAVAWHDRNTPAKQTRYCVLTEGPLDAGRIGPPAMAILGKSFSKNQCELICGKFGRYVYICDNDEAGVEAAAKVERKFEEVYRGSQLTVITPPEGVKDVGDMEITEAQEMVRKALT